MPYYNGNYLAPVWVNDQPPAINQTELLAMSQTIEESQILTGSGAPTQYVSGKVGQRYADTTTTPYTIYKLVEAAEDANIWEPDNADGNLALDYDASSTYDEGDFCIHRGLLYRANTDISPAEAWTPAHWTRAWLADELAAHIADVQNPHNVTAAQTGAYVKPAGGIPASDLANGVIPTVPNPSDATPQNLGIAAAGSSADYSRADHVHEKPTYTKSDIGLGNVADVLQYSASNKPSAADVTYDGTISGLTATDVKGALDELAQGGGGGGGSADDVTYDNTTSGLTATNVQDAIDEVVGDIPSVPAAYTSNPAMDGTASAGSSGSWAKGDHVHPSDTSRQPAIQSGTITLSTTWTPFDPGRYQQTVTVTGATVTANSMITLCPTIGQIWKMLGDGIAAMTIRNVDGVLTALTIGAGTSESMTIACTVTEVV